MESMAVSEVVAFLEWLWKYGPPSALAALAALGFYYREKIKQLLAFDVERLKADLAKQQADASAKLQRDLEAEKASFQRDLEAYRAGFQRELEAYKVGLIAEAERTKAAQDVLKAVALRVAERRFIAVCALMEATAGIDIDAAVIPTHAVDASQSNQYAAWRSELLERSAALAKAIRLASPFLSPDERMAFLQLHGKVVDSFDLRPTSAHPRLANSDPRLQAIIVQGIACEAILHRLFQSFEAMAAQAGAAPADR